MAAAVGVEAKPGTPREGNGAAEDGANNDGLAAGALTGAEVAVFLTFTIDLVLEGGATAGCSRGDTRPVVTLKFSNLNEHSTPSEVSVMSTGDGSMDFSPIMVGWLKL